MANMASIIPGYEYDIFISYRQKDNKGDKWVSEFVEALKTELDSTFKEEVSLYFDVNPHDGLLETHDVNASLKEKLKCLIFIPVISRTYCDPNSFAWQHEFIPFVETAKLDKFGLKINLPNGNVANRVLPVRIHDLGSDDIELCESVLGGVLRGIEFVYRSTGVNRPLRAGEDHPNDNLNKTYYRDQINKLANAIDEIIRSLKKSYSDHIEKPTAVQRSKITPGRIKKPVRKLHLSKNLIKIITIILPLVVLLSGAIFFIRSDYLKNNEKTIAIIPLTNPPNDIELGKYAVGSMDAIITKLQEIKSLTVRGRLSSLQYLDTKKPLNEIRNELKVNYLVEINISRPGKNPKMWIGLTRTRNDKELWASQYDMDEEQLMPLFTKIVQTIAGNLNVRFSGEEIINIEKDMTKNPAAYLNYLTASARLYSAMGNKYLDSVKFTEAIRFYDKAIESDKGFADAYARRAIARSWGIHTEEIKFNSTNIDKCWSDIVSAEKINKDLIDVQIAQGFYYYYCKKDYLNALMSFNTASARDPENYQPLFYMAMVYRAMGNWDKAHALIDKVIKFNPQEPLYLTNIGLCFDYLHDFDSAIIYHQKSIKSNPEWYAAYMNKIESLLLKYGNTKEAHSVLDSLIMISHETFPEYKIMFDIYDGRYSEAFDEADKAVQNDPGSKSIRYVNLADISSLMNKTADAGIYNDSALVVLNAELKNNQNNAEIHALIGHVYAGKGNKDKAINEGKKAIELTVADKNKIDEGEMVINLALIYTTLGLFDDALPIIENSLKNPSSLSLKMLQMDPEWKPLLSRKEIIKILNKYDKI
jgi:tetratricopeptide (TPR) repeat protein